MIGLLTFLSDFISGLLANTNFTPFGSWNRNWNSPGRVRRKVLSGDAPGNRVPSSTRYKVNIKRSDYGIRKRVEERIESNLNVIQNNKIQGIRRENGRKIKTNELKSKLSVNCNELEGYRLLINV